MNLRWMSQDKANKREDEEHAGEFDGVPVYIDYRLQPFFDDNPMRLTTSGFGFLRDIKLAPDHAFANFVSDLMQQVWDSPTVRANLRCEQLSSKD